MKKNTLPLVMLSLMGNLWASFQQEQLDDTEHPSLERTVSFSFSHPEDFIFLSLKSDRHDPLEGLYTAAEAGDFMEKNRRSVTLERSKIMAELNDEIVRLRKKPFYRTRETSQAFKAYRHFQILALRKDLRRKAALKRLESQGSDAPEK